MSICPFADQSHRYDGAFGGAYVTGPWRGVLHTTETTSLPSYQGGAVAPHFTIDPARLKSYQHYDTARPSRALQHPAGTIDTNNLHAIQFEIIAYSDEAIARSVGGLAVSQLTAEHYDYIAQHMRWVELAHGVRRTSGLTWKPYPASAGTGNGVRLSSSEWARFGGWCGHQHVPNNDHGDPSNIAIDRLLAGTPPEEPDVQLSDKVTVNTVDGGTETVTVNTILNRANMASLLTRGLITSVAKLTATEAAQSAAIQALTKGLDTTAVQKAITDAVKAATDNLEVVLKATDPNA